MSRYILAVVVVCCSCLPLSAGVIAFANFTPDRLTFTVTGPGKKPQTVTLARAQVAPVAVSGPADVTYPAKPANVTLRLDPYHAYVFIPDEKAGVRLEGVEMPGKPPEVDARPERNPVPHEPVKVPVTLLVDDADPRTDKLWQATLRKRFDEAAAVIEAHAGVKLEFAGFDTWKSDADAEDVQAAYEDFAKKVKVKPGALAIGYTSRIKSDEKKKDAFPYGTTRPFPTRHILLREWAPRQDPEKVEVVIHHLGLALGATLTGDPGSVMRDKIADGLAMHPEYRFRFDPLNVLAMNIWARELRRGPVGSVADASAENKARLTRVYKALLKTRPGDALALGYLNELDRDVAANPDLARKPEPAAKKEPDPIAKKDPPPNPTPRDQVAREVVRAITARAMANTGPNALSGDDLTTAYVKVAATTALREQGVGGDQYERAGGFMLGLGVALDDTDTLRNDPHSADTVKLVETEEERVARSKVIGTPTVRGRRDLCRRFAIGCGSGELFTQGRAEEAAIQRSFSKEALGLRSGISLPALAAEFAGIAFAQTDRTSLDPLRQIAASFSPADKLATLDGLRDGLSVERFKEEYGDLDDARFGVVIAAIRTRTKKLAPKK
jgi:hypothetical protein